MNEYYKERFRQYIFTSTNLRKQYEQGLSKIGLEEMSRNLKAFIHSCFGEELMRSDKITKTQKQQLLLSMLLIVYAHRHNKNDVFISETKLDTERRQKTDPELYFDFKIMRNVMYQYSKKAQQTFFDHPIESFYLAMFATSEEGKSFITHKPDKSVNKEKTRRMFNSL